MTHSHDSDLKQTFPHTVRPTSETAILEQHGLVQIAKRPRGSRKVKVPRVPFEEIALRIAI
jgi:hypothetical protein